MQPACQTYADGNGGDKEVTILAEMHADRDKVDVLRGERNVAAILVDARCVVANEPAAIVACDRLIQRENLFLDRPWNNRFWKGLDRLDLERRHRAFVGKTIGTDCAESVWSPYIRSIVDGIAD